MDVVILLVFISLALVAAGLVFFAFRLRAGDFDHGERLALTPLEDDETARPNRGAEQLEEDDQSENPEGGSLNVGS